MSWQYGHNSKGVEVGYGVRATCEHEGCAAKINRGLSFVCGGMHDGGKKGCGHYFCEKHLGMAFEPGPDGNPIEDADQVCPACKQKIEVAAETADLKNKKKRP